MKPRRHRSPIPEAHLWLMSFALSAVACQTSVPSESPLPASSVQEREGPTADVPAQDRPVVSAAEDPVDDVAGRAEELVRRAMEQAAAEADGDGEAGCEQAFREATRMLVRMREQGSVGEGIGPPRRAAFMRACARLPEDSRRCIVPSYSMTHAEECRRAREALDPELQREVRGLMNQAF